MSLHNAMKSVVALSLISGVALGANVAMAKSASDAKAATHTISLNAVSDPKDTFSKAKIEDAAGNSVGSVDEVMLDKTGKLTAIKVDVGGFLGVGDKDVAMKASALKFDPDRKVLITNMTKNQIKALPKAKS
jgi:PRC-barrel domain